MKIYLGLAWLALVGCATTAPQTKAVLQSPPNVANRVEIPGVPFIEQSAGHCGPATLAMAMQWSGHNISVDELAPRLMTPAMKGSLQEDMVSASRREGVMAVKISGMSSLLTELDAGHPVIIFENLGLAWYQKWHYAIVYGYDLAKEEFVMHSGPERGERVDMRIFERSWKLSDYWALVVLKPGALAASGNEIANLQAAAGLEQAGKLEAARVSYDTILRSWPDSLGGLVGLGNIAYAEKDFKKSVEVLRRAAKLYPDSKMVANNLRVAEEAAAIRRDQPAVKIPVSRSKRVRGTSISPGSKFSSAASRDNISDSKVFALRSFINSR